MFHQRFVRSWALAGALCASVGASPAQVLINEGFDHVDDLGSKGWVFANLSAPAGSVSSWYQGQSYLFTAQSGPDGSYAASNYAVAGDDGLINNWMVTPLFATDQAGTASFWIRGINEPGYSDLLSFGFSGGGMAITDFQLSHPMLAPADWTQVTLNFAAAGAGSMGRLAIVHLGLQSTSNYAGVDSLMVTAVPEPQAWALMALGLAGIGLIKLRHRQSGC